MRKEKPIRGWLMVIFGLPFFAVGIYFLFTTLSAVYTSIEMGSWHQTQGRLTSANLRSNRSSDTTTYEAEANYRYQVNGVEYQNDRVAIHGGSDNIGDFQQQLGRKLEGLHQRRQPVTVYYNPDDPSEAVLNRDIRWGMVGFMAIFIVMFGGAGLGLIIFGLRGKRVIDTPETAEKPWLARAEWADNQILSAARTWVYVLWFVAVIWNALSIPATIAVPEVWRDEGALALIILLFPLVGLGLLYWAVRKTLEWRRFGATPLRMDPFPGAIGGDVGGEIELGVAYVPNMACEVTLSSLYSYVSGSGKNRSRHEEVKWQDSGYAQVDRATRGIRLRFRFSVPEGLHPSEEEEGDYHLWRLNIKAELPGVDLDRSYTIPVYATAEKSRLRYLDSTMEVPRGAPEMTAESLLPLRRNARVQELFYPMFRQPGVSLVLLVVGTVFAITGVILWGKAQQEGGGLYFIGGIFTFLGGITAVAGFYMAFNTLYVAWDGKQVLSIRRLLGIRVQWKNAQYHELREIKLKQGATSNQKGSSHRINYHVVAELAKGEIVLAENLDSHSKAKLVVEFFRKQFRLGS